MRNRFGPELYSSRLSGGNTMSFMGLLPNERERRAASEEAAYALDKHGDKAALILLQKAQQTHSLERRRVYKMAAGAVKKMRG